MNETFKLHSFHFQDPKINLVEDREVILTAQGENLKAARTAQGEHL